MPSNISTNFKLVFYPIINLIKLNLFAEEKLNNLIAAKSDKTKYKDKNMNHLLFKES